MVTTSYKVKCVELTQNKTNILKTYINEYAKIYNIAGMLVPSLPKKYIDDSNGSKLYTKWIKTGSTEILKSDILSATMIQAAMCDALANYKTSGRVNQIKEPNVIKFANSEYRILELESSNPDRIADKRYAIEIKPLRLIIPVINGSEEWGVTSHLDKGIMMQENKKTRNKELQEKRKTKIDSKREKKVKAGLGQIVYNLRDNSFSIPNTVESPKMSKFINIDDVKTIIGVDLGVNNIAVMCAIDISNIDIDVLKHKKNIKMTSFSFKDVLGVKILKFKYIDGFENSYKMKQLRIVENKRRHNRIDVGHRRSDLKEFENHRVSHIIAEFASQYPNPIVIFEDNLGTLTLGKNSTWSPADARMKSDYKLAKYGINTFDVFSSYTSQTCHRCGAIGVRAKGDVHFKCISCGLGCGSNPQSTIGQYNADGNASVNIALRGLYVLTRPKKERETVEHTIGAVAAPNTNPYEDTQESNTPAIREVSDGTSVCKYHTTSNTMKNSISETNTIGVVNWQESNVMVEIHQVTESQKSDFLPVIKEKIILQEDEKSEQKSISARCC